MMHAFLIHGQDHVIGARSLVAALSAAVSVNPNEFSNEADFVSCREKSVHALQACKDLTFVVSEMAGLVGNVTVAQACARDLITGETRQALVQKAWTGVRKREWNVHKSLAQRCNVILTGKK
jgi:hypothetical protein